MKPVFVEVADNLYESDPSVKLAAIDGTKSNALMKKYDMSGFPTLLYFKYVF